MLRIKYVCLLTICVLLVSSTCYAKSKESNFKDTSNSTLGVDLDAEVFQAQEDAEDIVVPVLNLNQTKKEIAYEVGCLKGVQASRKAVILKGMDLMCHTKYLLGAKAENKYMGKPNYLDCSGYVQWTLLRAAGYDIGHGTAAQYANSTPIEGEELQIGDLGFKLPGGVENLGGNNHVGIFIGHDSKGRELWLHCTSGKQNGVNISNYTGFRYYARPKCYK